MTPDEFMEAVDTHVSEAAITSTISNLLDPPGQKPRQELIQSSTWYKSLSAEEQQRVNEIIRRAVGHALFAFFCVLDGVRAVESGDTGGDFELYYVKDNERIRLNDPKGEELHNLYNWYSRDRHA